MKPTTQELLTIDTALEFLMKEMKEVAGQWDGKDSGRQEELSMCAGDIVEKADELRGLLDEFNDI